MSTSESEERVIVGEEEEEEDDDIVSVRIDEGEGDEEEEDDIVVPAPSTQPQQAIPIEEPIVAPNQPYMVQSTEESLLCTLSNNLDVLYQEQFKPCIQVKPLCDHSQAVYKDYNQITTKSIFQACQNLDTFKQVELKSL